MQALDDDDDYVASLLKRDAEKHSNRFGSAGSTASKRRPDAPRPNLRFLKNVLRDVDSHNTALKQREEEESRAKAQEWSRDYTGSRKRAREDDEASRRSKRHQYDPIKERKGRWKDVLQVASRSPRDSGERHPTGKSPDSGTRERKSRQNSRDGKRSSRRRSRSSPRLSSSDHSHRKERKRRRSSRRSCSRSRSPEPRSRGSRHEERHRSSAPTALKRDRDRDPVKDAEDSDPLEDIIGPRAAPKVKHRGRGAPSTSTTMDSHFRSDYDPKADVSMTNEDGDEWEMALEALRDRAKWKAQGADRLKAAGFTDDQVKRWEKGGEKGIEDVVWRKKGEDREWDRGKTIDVEGEVDTTPEWGQLKGT